MNLFLNRKVETGGLSMAFRAVGCRLPVAAALAAGLAAPVLAHHSYVMFDRTRTATASGVVTAWNWTNPHISLRMKRDITAPGKTVTVTYHPMANGSPGGQLMKINGIGPD